MRNAVLPELFPTAEEFADNVDPARNAPFFSERGAPRVQFPFEHAAFNRVALHDAVLDIAETLLETRDIRVYQAGVAAKYSDAAPDYEQLLHADYANHTLVVVPRTDVGYQHLDDVRLPHRRHALDGRDPLRVSARAHRRHPDRADVPASRRVRGPVRVGGTRVGPAGSVLVYRPDVFHRGVPSAHPARARF